MIRLLLIAAASEAHPASASILRNLAEQFRDAQAESIDDDILQIYDPVERDRFVQKVDIYESLLEKHPDAVTLCANRIQKQFGVLANIDKQWKDEAASPLVRTIAETYREAAIQVGSFFSLFFFPR